MMRTLITDEPGGGGFATFQGDDLCESNTRREKQKRDGVESMCESSYEKDEDETNAQQRSRAYEAVVTDHVT